MATRFEVVLLEEAIEDIFEAIEWYEKQQAGLGEQLDEEVKTDLNYLIHSPFHEVVFKDASRFNVNRFPYSLFYYIVKSEIVVFAVVSGKRDPKVWQERR